MQVIQTITHDVPLDAPEGTKPAQTIHEATYDGKAFASDNASFALWLNSAFHGVPADAIVTALKNVGLDVKGAVPHDVEAITITSTE